MLSTISMKLKLAIIVSMAIWMLFSSTHVKAAALDKYYIYSTTLLSYKIDNVHKSSSTGFFVFKAIDNNVGQVFLITNRHAIPKEGEQKGITVRVNIKTNDKIYVKELPIDIVGQDNVYLPSVKFHPNKEYDVAAVNVTQEINRSNIKGVWIPYELFATKSMMKDEDITIGSEVLILGYPDAIYDPRNIFPVLRKGIISTVPFEGYSFNESLVKIFKLPKHIDGFLVDASIFPGSSGSLVILKQQPNPIGFRGAYSGKGPKNIPYVLGIISGSIPMFDVALGSVQRIGLGVVYSAETIKETIEQFY